MILVIFASLLQHLPPLVGEGGCDTYTVLEGLPALVYLVPCRVGFEPQDHILSLGFTFFSIENRTNSMRFIKVTLKFIYKIQSRHNFLHLGHQLFVGFVFFVGNTSYYHAVSTTILFQPIYFFD